MVVVSTKSGCGAVRCVLPVLSVVPIDDGWYEDDIVSQVGWMHCCVYIIDVMVDRDCGICDAIISGHVGKSKSRLGGRTNPALINVVPPIPFPVLTSIIRYHSYQRLCNAAVVDALEEDEDDVFLLSVLQFALVILMLPLVLLNKCPSCI